MKSYYWGNYFADDGTLFAYHFEARNKRSVIAFVRRSAASQRKPGKMSYWYVWRGPVCVAAGYIDDKGYHRLPDDVLSNYDFTEEDA